MPGTLRRWTLRRPVEAGPIVAIEDHHIVIEGMTRRVQVHRPPDFFIRNGRPMPGDYLIIGSRGKIAWLAADVFQDDYAEERPALIVP